MFARLSKLSYFSGIFFVILAMKCFHIAKLNAVSSALLINEMNSIVVLAARYLKNEAIFWAMGEWSCFP